MATPRNRRHIIVHGDPAVESYSPHPRKIDVKKPPAPPSRPAHGAALKKSIEDAASKGAIRRREAEDAGIKVHGAVPGLYVEFQSRPGVRLKLSSLEDARAGIELVAVTETKTNETEPKRVQHATVFVPDGKVKHFISRFEKYAQAAPKKKGERRHEGMIDPVATLRLATLRGLWTDAPDAYPAENECIWWEVWLRRHDGKELARLMEFASLQKLDVSERRLQFDERIVTLVKARPNELASSIDVLNDLAEVHRAKETAALFVDMGPDEQADWAKELLARVTSPGGDAPAACILDTGVNRGHPLLEVAVAAEDCTAVDPTWGDHDDGGGPDMMGHGTQMAGLALYGDLTPVLAGSDPVHLQHRLESVKILPPSGANPPELYGTITAEAACRVEVQAPDRSRCFAMAVTATDERDRGKPTSWSSAVDALAAGRVFDQTTQGLVYLDDDGDDHHRRLFIVSAGNVDANSLAVAHLDQSDTEPVHDPAQAWNALTVGAFTERVSVQDASWQGWAPVAAGGDLSPWSTTSVTFAKPWPLKPDVVFEGGNVVRNSKDEVDFPCADLCLLSTHFKPTEKPFVVSYATSAATAQAARMAAIIKAQYPDLWPEAVRGLIVHSAEWTRAMQGHLRGAGGKREREMLVRRYGFGVPRLNRALRSANDSLTLIAQGSIRPFAPGDKDPKKRTMGDMHFFELPWPTDVLQSLGEHPVRLRVTLSYFIEPNPGRRGWAKRHRYASHGLRFDVKGSTESLDEFRKRLNKQALDEEEEKPKADGSDSWYLGSQARNRGSVHSDILSGFAADLAERSVVGVYPVSGWWKDQPARDRSHKGAHYAIIVSIETDATDVDIWTPVANQVGVPVEVDIET
jgi:hypothetical protein